VKFLQYRLTIQPKDDFSSSRLNELIQYYLPYDVKIINNTPLTNGKIEIEVNFFTNMNTSENIIAIFKGNTNINITGSFINDKLWKGNFNINKNEKGGYRNIIISGGSLLNGSQLKGNFIKKIFIDPNKLLKDKILYFSPDPFTPNGDGINDKTYIKLFFNSGVKSTLQVMTLKGERIKTLFENQELSGEITFSWNGKDEFNNFVKPGLYLFHITTEKGFNSVGTISVAY